MVKYFKKVLVTMFNLLISENIQIIKVRQRITVKPGKPGTLKKIFGLLLCCKKKANQACKKTELQQEP